MPFTHDGIRQPTWHMSEASLMIPNIKEAIHYKAKLSVSRLSRYSEVENVKKFSSYYYLPVLLKKVTVNLFTIVDMKLASY